MDLYKMFMKIASHAIVSDKSYNKYCKAKTCMCLAFFMSCRTGFPKHNEWLAKPIGIHAKEEAVR
jgi:hypothetical protein